VVSVCIVQYVSLLVSVCAALKQLFIEDQPGTGLVFNLTSNASQLSQWFTVSWNELRNQEGMKSRVKSGNACYHSVHNILSPIWISKNIKIKIY
jgi:hypothetical protein